LVFAIEVLGNRMAGVATESEVNKMVPEYASYENPFLNLQRELHQFLDKFRNDITLVVDQNNIDYRQILVLHGQCEEFVNQAYKNIAKYGISIRVNQYFLRINQQLKRLKKTTGNAD
jgi:site-specific recombinase